MVRAPPVHKPRLAPSSYRPSWHNKVLTCTPDLVRRCDSLVVNLPWIERGERNLVAPACGTRQEERNLNLVAPACGAGQEERNLKAMS